MFTLIFRDGAGTEFAYTKNIYNLSFSNKARGGPSTLQATLPIELINNTITEGMDVSLYYRQEEIWLGRVEDIPFVAKDKAAAVIGCIGYGSALMDDVFQEVYIDSKYSSWKQVDANNKPTYVEKDASHKFRVDNANRLAVLVGEATYQQDDTNGWIWVRPSGVNITKFTASYAKNYRGTDFTAQLWSYTGDAGVPAWTKDWDDTTNGAASGTISETYGANVTHLLFRVQCVNVSGHTTPGADAEKEGDWYGRLTNLKVYGTTINTTVYTSDVLKNILALVPNISTNYDKVAATTYDNPHLSFPTPTRYIDGIIEADKPHLNNYGFWDRDTSVNPRFWYEAHSLTTIHYYASLKNTVPDLSGASLQDRYNKVIVSYQDQNGATLYETRTATDAGLNTLGITRAAEISLDTSSQGKAQQYGDTFLTPRARKQSKGQITVRNEIIDQYGRRIHPFQIKAGKNIMITDLQIEPSDIDDMTAANVINGKNIFKITQADIDVMKNEARLQLEIPGDSLDLFLARRIT